MRNDMSTKMKLGLTSALILIVAGGAYAIAQTRNVVVDTKTVATDTSDADASTALESKQSPLPATATLTEDDQKLILSLLVPEFSTAKELQIAELKEPVSYTHLTLPTNREV